MLRGENAGRQLRHDYVARAFAEAQTGVPLDVTFTMDRTWDRSRLAVVAFAADPSTGDILQAVSLQHLD